MRYCGDCQAVVGPRKHYCEECRKKRKAAKHARWYEANKEKADAYIRKWERENPDKKNAHMRNHYLKKEYGITIEGYEEIFQQQGGVCAICKRPPGKRRLAVDHDHKTGKIRGLLDGACNKALGLFRDDVTLLQAAIDYLKKKAPSEEEA